MTDEIVLPRKLAMDNIASGHIYADGHRVGSVDVFPYSVKGTVALAAEIVSRWNSPAFGPDAREIVAKALFVHDDGGVDDCWATQGAASKERYYSMADAALRALGLAR